MVRAEIEIINKLGLHARASAKLTQLVGRFSSEVWLTKGSRRINAKSIMGVMMLAAGKGTILVLEIDGADEDVALNAVVQLVADCFDEAE